MTGFSSIALPAQHLSIPQLSFSTIAPGGDVIRFHLFKLKSFRANHTSASLLLKKCSPIALFKCSEVQELFFLRE